jgi:hypothetical protein
MGVEWSREEIIQRGQKKYVTMSWLPTYNCEYNITFLFLLGILISPKKGGSNTGTHQGQVLVWNMWISWIIVIFFYQVKFGMHLLT